MDEQPTIAARAGWSPPPRWRRLPATVEGFEVWAPSQDDVPTELEPRIPTCPTCGAGTRFDPGLGGVACDACGWKTEGPAPSAVQAHRFTEDALRRAATGFGVARRELACAACGATLAIEPTALTATCPFCASNQVSVRPSHPGFGIRPHALSPFTVLVDDCRRRAREWLGRGWFHPWDLTVLARVDSFTGVYVPFWVFDATVDAEWRANVGHARTERVWNAQERRHEAHTVIDWRWQTGGVRLDVADLRVPATTRIGERWLTEAQRDSSLQGLVAYDPDLLAGFQAHTWDRTLADAWELGRHAMRERGREACRADIGSPHVRSLSVGCDLQDERWRLVLLPLWLSAYRYGDRTFVVLVDGTSGRVVGQKPVVWRRVWFVIALLLAPGLGLTIIGVPLLLLAVGALVLPAGLVLLVLGGLASAWLWSDAARSEEA